MERDLTYELKCAIMKLTYEERVKLLEMLKEKGLL